jgi:hypothetical protein
MVTSRFKIMSLLIFLLSAVSVLVPVFAQNTQDYSAGVTKGQYVKYGNFVGIGSEFQAYNNNDWMMYEVAKVNITQVDLILTGKFKNGTAFLGNGDTWVYDVTLLGTVNGTSAGQNPIIATKLSKYVPLTPYVYDASYAYVNDTQTRSYLGVSRTVNILSYSSTTENGTNTLTYTYDQDSGMLLEMVGESQQTSPTQATLRFSYSVTDTNIFGPNAPILGLPALYFYAGVGVVVGVAIAVGVVVFRRRSGRNKKRRRQKKTY